MGIKRVKKLEFSHTVGLKNKQFFDFIWQLLWIYAIR